MGPRWRKCLEVWSLVPLPVLARPPVTKGPTTTTTGHTVAPQTEVIMNLLPSLPVCQVFCGLRAPSGHSTEVAWRLSPVSAIPHSLASTLLSLPPRPLRRHSHSCQPPPWLNPSAHCWPLVNMKFKSNVSLDFLPGFHLFPSILLKLTLAVASVISSDASLSSRKPSLTLGLTTLRALSSLPPPAVCLP